jgi:hypothetical protein
VTRSSSDRFFNFNIFSLLNFREFAWWDPTAFNGWPSYFYATSIYISYLSPYTLPALALAAIGHPLGASINTLVILHLTLISYGLNLLAIMLISRELIRDPLARFLPALIFTLSEISWSEGRNIAPKRRATLREQSVATFAWHRTGRRVAQVLPMVLRPCCVPDARIPDLDSPESLCRRGRLRHQFCQRLAFVMDRLPSLAALIGAVRHRGRTWPARSALFSGWKPQTVDAAPNPGCRKTARKNSHPRQRNRISVAWPHRRCLIS